MTVQYAFFDFTTGTRCSVVVTHVLTFYVAPESKSFYFQLKEPSKWTNSLSPCEYFHFPAGQHQRVGLQCSSLDQIQLRVLYLFSNFIEKLPISFYLGFGRRAATTDPTTDSKSCPHQCCPINATVKIIGKHQRDVDFKGFLKID